MVSKNDEKRLIGIAQRLLLPYEVTLQATDFQHPQRTLHITYAPLLSKETVDLIKQRFKQETGWTLGMSSAALLTVSAEARYGGEIEEKQILNIVRQLLIPYNATLQNPKFQSQQRTLHISCTPVLPQEAVDQIKIKFRQATGWTVGITLIPRQGATSTDDSYLLARDEEQAKQKLLDIVRQLLIPYHTTLRNPKFQFQQRTLHVICTPILPQEAIDQMKAAFKRRTGWTLGMASGSRQGNPSSTDNTYLLVRNEEQAEQRSLLDKVQILLISYNATLQDVRFQFQQRTLHIRCTPDLSQEAVDQMKAAFKRGTRWTLGMSSGSRQGNISMNKADIGEEQEEQKRFLNIAQQLLPYDVTLQSITFQFQQRTLHISCTPVLNSETINQVKALFQFITGWTLGVTSFSLSGQETSEGFKNGRDLLLVNGLR